MSAECKYYRKTSSCRSRHVRSTRTTCDYYWSLRLGSTFSSGYVGMTLSATIVLLVLFSSAQYMLCGFFPITCTAKKWTWQLHDSGQQLRTVHHWVNTISWSDFEPQNTIEASCRLENGPKFLHAWWLREHSYMSRTSVYAYEPSSAWVASHSFLPQCGDEMDTHLPWCKATKEVECSASVYNNSRKRSCTSLLITRATPLPHCSLRQREHLSYHFRVPPRKGCIMFVSSL